MKAFFDIDTQIDFLFPAGALYGPGSERLVAPVAALNHYAGNHGIPLISTTCAHPEDAEEFEVWPPHCIVGTVGQLKPAATLLEKRVTIPNVPAELNVAGAQQIILEKNALDMFSNPNVHALLDKLDIDECFVYGVFTEYCVKGALMGLLQTGRRVSLVTKATAHLDKAAGDTVVAEFLAAGGHLRESEF